MPRHPTKRTASAIALLVISLTGFVPGRAQEAPAAGATKPPAAAPAAAATTATQPAPAPAGPAAAKAAQPPADSVTHHAFRARNQTLRYTATAGTLPAGDNPAAPTGDIFYVAYTLDGAPAGTRPIAFVFNGGPGAAAAYLHLGAMGPKRVAFGEAGTIPPPPARLVDNEESWLPFVDLVFVDPPGTGYSRIAERKDGAEENGSGPWNVRRDLRTLAAFVRLYLTRNNRWSSPRFVVGESYGGFRAAALPRTLERDFGVGLNGALLVSPVIEFSLQDEDRYRIVPWALRLPSYAAAAWHHGRTSAAPGVPWTAESIRQAAEEFARGEYLTGLASGKGTQARAFVERLAQLTGLPAEVLQRHDGRIGASMFAKELLRDSGRILGLYDASIATADPNPERPGVGGDSTLDPISARLTEALAGYVANELGYRTDRAYLTLNREISRRWDWKSALEGGQGFVGAADALKAMLVRNAGFGVFIAHGMYDLVTPYFASTFVIEQMDLPEAARRKVKLAVYGGGHMMYTHRGARRDLGRDAESFIAGVLEREDRTPAP